ncbi:hypothetical protein [Paraburkholderia tropica]|uniref:hypothetical protein n=1 Tax=Paraburkholderia tropica TaxID=92647 RepID=UPI001CC6EB1E|nr:hypothetical protein [Paraburkholderia tropica]
MKNKLYPNIDFEIGADFQVICNLQNDSRPDDDFVMSRGRDGKAASRFGDIVWDFSIYSLENRALNFYFKLWDGDNPTENQLKLSREVRFLVFAFIYMRKGRPMKISTLATMNSVLQLIAGFADRIEASLSDVFSNARLLRKFVNSMCPGWALQFLGGLLRNIRCCRTGWLGFSVVGYKDTAFLRLAIKKWREKNNQHPPMPTRVYSLVLVSLIREMVEWDVIGDEILRVALECAKNPALGRSPAHQYKISRKMSEQKPQEEDLKGLLTASTFDVFRRRYRCLSVGSLSAMLGEAQMVLRMVIQAFSGIRIGEVNLLHYNCIEKIQVRGGIHYIINGRTTKFSGGESKKAKWVTNESGYRAITLAKK